MNPFSHSSHRPQNTHHKRGVGDHGGVHGAHTARPRRRRRRGTRCRTRTGSRSNRRGVILLARVLGADTTSGGGRVLGALLLAGALSLDEVGDLALVEEAGAGGGLEGLGFFRGALAADVGGLAPDSGNSADDAVRLF